MEICKIHYKVSKPVAGYKEIKAEAEALRRFIVLGKFKGYYNKAFAIVHCQVSETPFAFFVCAPECVKEKMFVDDVIINPQIVEAKTHIEIMGDKIKGAPKELLDKAITVPNTIEYQEPCMSFPFRTPKKVVRFNKIKVQYQVAGFFGGLKTIKADLQGIASEIFQHEYDHTQGKNIYFETETPVKWWELIGTEKSKGGTSLDAPEGLNLKQTKEKPAFQPRKCQICGHVQGIAVEDRCEHQAKEDEEIENVES
jgi:peptide deformylase